jgi:hypothetical protein
MSMRKTIEVVAKLAELGAFRSYAIAGAVAALNYIEPTLTEDLDILISFGDFERRASDFDFTHPDRESPHGNGLCGSERCGLYD